MCMRVCMCVCVSMYSGTCLIRSPLDSQIIEVILNKICGGCVIEMTTGRFHGTTVYVQCMCAYPSPVVQSTDCIHPS